MFNLVYTFLGLLYFFTKVLYGANGLRANMCPLKDKAARNKYQKELMAKRRQKEREDKAKVEQV